ncbi:alanine racemase [Catenulispora yoronensis]|uniref:Alanine racemase n=1 Tax=Catenulispora yoronensis TaxID=450799 RepID=A0ABN2TWX9_9ACTN
MTDQTANGLTPGAGPVLRAEAVIDLDAVRANTARVGQIAAGSGAGLMAVVKADAYGHGAAECARAAKQAGAAWLGTALPEEALELRAAGITGPILSWLHHVGGPWDALIRNDIDVTAYASWALDEIVAAAQRLGIVARVQLKADTGLGRGGTQPHDWLELVERAAKAEAAGHVKITGLWSHFACADEPGHPSIQPQLDAFGQALAVADQAGLRPEVRHMANSPATFTLPEAHFDLVRPGLALYGLSPLADVTPAELGLRPAMTLRGRVALVKTVPAGHGVSYGHSYHTDADTSLALIPLGYADGLPRNASNIGEALVGGQRYRVAGRMAMDHFVVDLEDPAAVDRVHAGDEVVVFGPGDRGEPTADDWARAAGTLNYEIVTRIGPRVPRVYVGKS